MSLFGAPLEWEQLEAIRADFPGFRGQLPEEAKYWKKADVELFLGSGGQTRPREIAQKNSQTCALLTRARMRLAEARISEPPPEYRSFCRQLKDAHDGWRLASVTECAEVQRARSVPSELRAPVIIEKQREWKARMWNMDFWKRACGDDVWVCQARCPTFQDDVTGAESLAVEATISEYVDYVRLVQRMDRKCAEDNGVAYPRVSIQGWSPFCRELLPLFAGCWKALGPPGLKDLTCRWVQCFSQALGADWISALARFYHVSIGATGTVSRLHTEGNGAHAWFNQVEGRRVFYLFPPQEAARLYAGYTTRVSPVDVFFPSAKRHPRFGEVRSQVGMLYLGQTLIIPSGWWWYSVALEPSVTLSHLFWNMDNKIHFTQALREHFEFSSGPRSIKENIAMSFGLVHEQVMADEDSEVEE